MYHKCQFHISSVVKPVCRPRSKYLIFKRTTSARPGAGLLDCVLLRIAANCGSSSLFLIWRCCHIGRTWKVFHQEPFQTPTRWSSAWVFDREWKLIDDHCVQSYSRNVTIITPIPITSQCVQFYSPLSPIPTAWDPIISDNQVVWSLAALEREP